MVGVAFRGGAIQDNEARVTLVRKKPNLGSASLSLWPLRLAASGDDQCAAAPKKSTDQSRHFNTAVRNAGCPLKVA